MRERAGAAPARSAPGGPVWAEEMARWERRGVRARTGAGRDDGRPASPAETKTEISSGYEVR
jgi:hypothetical protein